MKKKFLLCVFACVLGATLTMPSVKASYNFPNYKKDLSDVYYPSSIVSPCMSYIDRDERWHNSDYDNTYCMEQGQSGYLAPPQWIRTSFSEHTTPSYAYFSNAPDVCVIDANGRAIAKGIGTAVIAVTCTHCGSFIPITVHVLPPKWSLTKEYTSLVSSIDDVCQKYHQTNLTDKNCENAIKEIANVNTKLQNYFTSYIKSYGMDADSLNKTRKGNPFKNLSDLKTVEDIMYTEDMTEPQCESICLESASRDFSYGFLITGNVCAFQETIHCMINHIKSWNPYVENSKYSFKINSMVADNKKKTLTIALKKPVSSKQIWGSYYCLQEGSRLKTEAWLCIIDKNIQANVTEIPCRIELYKNNNLMGSYLGKYQPKDKEIICKYDSQYKKYQKLKPGTYCVKITPFPTVVNEFTYNQDCCFESKNILEIKK